MLVAFDRDGDGDEQTIVFGTSYIRSGLVAVAGAVETEFLLHVGLPVGTAGGGGGVDDGGWRLVGQDAEDVIVDIADQGDHRAVVDRRRQRFGGHGTAGTLALA